VQIGDVVVANKVSNYEGGKAAHTFQPRPDAWHPSHKLVQMARVEREEKNWLRRLGKDCPDPAPKVYTGPLAAGEKVLSATTSSVSRLVQGTYSDALAVEMEGHGFLAALHSYPEVQSLIIRGISDLIEGKVQADASGSQELAARHAAAFAFEILALWEEFLPPHQQDPSDRLQSTQTTSEGAPKEVAPVEQSILQEHQAAPLEKVQPEVTQENPLATLAQLVRNIESRIPPLSVEQLRVLSTLTEHTNAVNSVAIGPYGERLFGASADGTIKVWGA
jgi:hypothetical protein